MHEGPLASEARGRPPPPPLPLPEALPQSGGTAAFQVDLVVGNEGAQGFPHHRQHQPAALAAKLHQERAYSGANEREVTSTK